MVTGKTAGKQGKCSLGLFPRAYSCLTPYTLHPTLQAKQANMYHNIHQSNTFLALFGLRPLPTPPRCIALISLWQKWAAINYGRRTTRNPRMLPRTPRKAPLRLATRQWEALLLQPPPRFTRADPDDEPIGLVCALLL